MLNPFSQELKPLRTASLEKLPSPSNVIKEQLLGLNGTPTLLIATASTEEVERCIRQIASAAPDFGSTVDRLRQFRGNPWKRISKEVEEADKSLLPGSKANPEREATEQDILDYASIILDERNIKEELKAFYSAWDGSINFQKSSGNTEIATTAMPLTEMTDAMDILLKSL